MRFSVLGVGMSFRREFTAESDTVSVEIVTEDGVDVVTVKHPDGGQFIVRVEDGEATAREAPPEWAKKPLRDVGIGAVRVQGGS
jgi:hypothetical protein